MATTFCRKFSDCISVVTFKINLRACIRRSTATQTNRLRSEKNVTIQSLRSIKYKTAIRSVVTPVPGQAVLGRLLFRRICTKEISQSISKRDTRWIYVKSRDHCQALNAGAPLYSDVHHFRHQSAIFLSRRYQLIIPAQPKKTVQET